MPRMNQELESRGVDLSQLVGETPPTPTPDHETTTTQPWADQEEEEEEHGDRERREAGMEIYEL